MKNKILVIDLDTGREFQTIQVKSIGALPPYKDFFMADQARTFELAATLSSTALRVWTGLQATMDYQNNCDITQTELAERLNLDVTRVCRGINQLCEKGVITKVKHRGRFYTYKVNSAYARKGRQLKAVK